MLSESEDYRNTWIETWYLFSLVFLFVLEIATFRANDDQNGHRTHRITYSMRLYPDSFPSAFSVNVIYLVYSVNRYLTIYRKNRGDTSVFFRRLQ